MGPDNGLLWPAAARLGTPVAHALANPAYRLPEVSATFHGRDVFAPAAAALASGVAPSELGPSVPNPIRLELPKPQRVRGALVGEVLWIDHFGNLITNLSPADLGEPALHSVRFVIGSHSPDGPSASYSAVRPGEACVVLSSFGTYEIAVRDGSAAEALGARRGERVRATLLP